MALIRTALALLLWLVCTHSRAEPVPAAEALSADWTGQSARIEPRAHGQIALLGESRIGVGHSLQVGFHVAGLAALTPHASLLYRFFERRGLHVAARLGVAYPWPTLWLLTGEGAGALLPGDTKPAHALFWDLGGRASLELPRQQLITFEAALVVASKFREGTAPVLDFPFLYPRFAPLDAPLTVRLAPRAEGVIAGAFRWVGALDIWIVPVVKRGFALEPRAGLAWVSLRRVSLELGYRASYARYPVGLRFHGVPYFDVRVRF